MRQRNFRHSNRETYYEIWMRKSCLQPPETLVFVFFLEDNVLFIRKRYVYVCVCVCVCVCTRACRVLLCLFDYVIDLKHGVLSTFFFFDDRAQKY